VACVRDPGPAAPLGEAAGPGRVACYAVCRALGLPSALAPSCPRGAVVQLADRGEGQDGNHAIEMMAVQVDVLAPGKAARKDSQRGPSEPEAALAEQVAFRQRPVACGLQAVQPVCIQVSLVLLPTDLD
jgi:hypothetical protein